MSTNPNRERMIAEQLRPHGISDERVLAAMAELPREEFVPERGRRHAYEDHPLVIGGGQTISQPLVVAAMTAAVAPQPAETALEVGAGSGYQAALLARLCRQVVAIERDRQLAESATATLGRLGITNVTIEHADGSLGWPPLAPYQVIVVSAAAEGAVPEVLLDQLADGGRLVAPVAQRPNQSQELLLVEKRAGRLQTRALFPVLFVPLVKGTVG